MLGPLKSCRRSDYSRVEFFRSDDDLIMQPGPEPDVFEPPTEPDPTINLKGDYTERGLQIIVKFSNIHLMPENPSFEGRYWHVEGQLVSFTPYLYPFFFKQNLIYNLGKNEHICATALYYYSNEKITDSNLTFRRQSSIEFINVEFINVPEQVNSELFSDAYGCELGGPGLQFDFYGNIETHEGRLLT